MRHPNFHPLAVHVRDYPPGRLATQPFPSWSSIFAGRACPVPSAFLDRRTSFLTFSRYALAEALRRLGVGGDGAALLPAAHCRSMVEPAIHLDADIRFYPVTPDLRPDFSAMDGMVRDGRVRALLLSHYFGFPNALDQALDFCARHDIALIEDCSHAFYGEYRGRPLGTFGSYATASAWKFLPVKEGAMLRDNRGGLPMKLRRPPMLAQAKGLASMVRSGLEGARRAKQWKPRDIDAMDLLARADELAGKLAQEGGGDPGMPTFMAESTELAGLAASRALIAVAAHARVIHRRRENYRRWLDAVAGCAGIDPLFPDLPEGVVPYAFPLLGDAGGKLFHVLKLAGIPLWRWEDTAVTECPVSEQYRFRLLQLPCHQDLTEAQLDWMLAVVKSLSPSGHRGSARE